MNLAHALVETKSLRSWFFALEKLPPALRKDAFSSMAAKMCKAGEDLQLTDAVAALARPKMYESVLEAVRERCS